MLSEHAMVYNLKCFPTSEKDRLEDRKKLTVAIVEMHLFFIRVLLGFAVATPPGGLRNER